MFQEAVSSVGGRMEPKEEAEGFQMVEDRSENSTV